MTFVRLVPKNHIAYLLLVRNTVYYYGEDNADIRLTPIAP